LEIGEVIVRVSFGRKLALATSTVSVPAISKTDIVSVSANAVLFITAPK
jgi:hypothetical protein